jgi:YbbR domain-containing protein
MRAKHTLYLSFFLSVLLLTATQNVFGQAGNAQITANDPRHETLNQREVSVLFDQTILSATTAGWAVTVNAIPVTVNSVLVVGNRVNITFDATPAHAAQTF